MARPDPVLDPEAVRAAAARWIYVPVDATEVTRDDYRLTHYTDYSSVQWSRTSPNRTCERSRLPTGTGLGKRTFSRP